jgi:stage III sporulation protein SpoIIIAA
LVPRPAITDDLEALLAVFPTELRRRLEGSPRRKNLLEVVLDLGRAPEARYVDGVEDLAEEAVTTADLEHVVRHLGSFGKDNRAGLARTLHRISAMRNRQGAIVGLTCRVGRAVPGTIAVIRDALADGRSVLLLGRPGVGKTTLLREAARVLAGEFGKRVIVVDTSNEIAGDGDIPHAGIGRARRLQVPAPEEQHGVMIEAVENHMPEVIVIDEIGTAAEAAAARTIAERGVQLVATAHGNTLDNLLQNPTLSDLVGGVQAVILSDDEARRRGSQKTVLERRSPPTFQTLVEIQTQERFAVHRDVADVVDRALRGREPQPEIRLRQPDGGIVVETPAAPVAPTREPLPAAPGRRSNGHGGHGAQGGNGVYGQGSAAVALAAGRSVRLFPYAVSRSRIERAARELRIPVQIVAHPEDADLLMALKSHEKRHPPRLRHVQARGVPLLSLRSNTSAQIQFALGGFFGRARRGAEADDAAEHGQHGALAPEALGADGGARLDVAGTIDDEA